jgi:cold shock CspA family protein
VSNSPTIREQMISRGLIQAQKAIQFEEWVEGGFDNEPGRVEIFFRALGFGIIQPDRFRERRLIVHREALESQPIVDSPQPGSIVLFDLEPQTFHKSQLPQVSACRLLLPKGSK